MSPSDYVAENRPLIASIAADAVRGLRPEHEVDFVGEFTAPVPFRVNAALLGVPPWPILRASTRRILIALVKRRPSSRQLALAAASILFFHRAFSHFLQRKERAPGNDLISFLLERGDLTRRQILYTSAFLLIAGNETTTHNLGNGILALLQHAEARETLCATPSLFKNAVEEILRYDGSVQGVGRIAKEDIEYGGVTFRKGDHVTLLLGSANRDPEVFANPDELDVARPNAGKHLSFGHGRHRCLGKDVARAVIEESLRALSPHFPRLARRPPRVEWIRAVTHRGPRRMWVRW